MICPNCKKANLIVKDNNYFCPICNIYIGPVGQKIQSFAPDATSRWQMQPQIQPSSSIIDDGVIKPQAPLLLLIISWLQTISGVLSIILSIFPLILIQFKWGLNGVLPIALILAAGGVLMGIGIIVLSLGLRHLRKWSLVIYKIVAVIMVVAFCWLLFRGKLDFETTIKFVISMLVFGYIWSKSSLFV